MNIPLTPLRFLRYASEQFPNKVGLVCDDRRYTYSQFAERCGRLGGALLEAGTRPSDRIAFLSTNCHRLLEAYYGVLEAGCILLPLNIRLAPQELVVVLNDAKARFLFLEAKFLPLIDAFKKSCPTVEQFILLDAQPHVPALHSKSYEELLDEAVPFHADIMQVDENDVAELFYTSGTSDMPKGVMLTHRNVYLHALNVIVAGQTSKIMGPHTTGQTVTLHTIPLFHANGWGAAHTITLVGGTHVMVHAFTPLEVFRLIEQERVWCCALVPTMANALIHSPERTKFDLSSLRLITIGGAASSPALVKEVEEKLGCTCISGYGLTETAPAIAFSPIKTGVDWRGEQKYSGQAMTGFAIPGVKLRVADPAGCEVPHDGKSIGEIHARGDGVMKGYWEQPEATRNVMEGNWFHTGDMATVDENNYILIVDRKKDIIISGGENISSLEVEKVLSAHPSIFEAMVIPIPDERWGEIPKAIVVLKPGSQVTEMEVMQYCRSKLAHYKCPRSVDFVESLPKSGTGKILKKELREKYAAAQKTAT